jgi:hypothetical protein
MKAITGKVERLRPVGFIETSKNILDVFQQVGPYPAPIVAFIEPFQTATLETLNHEGTP